MNKLIQIHPKDNVLIVRQRIEPGDTETVHEKEIVFDKTLGLGHKIAAVDLREGDIIIKYGVPIGSATMDISAGTHIHLHNMKSDYIPTYTLDEEFIHAK